MRLHLHLHLHLLLHPHLLDLVSNLVLVVDVDGLPALGHRAHGQQALVLPQPKLRNIPHPLNSECRTKQR